MEVGSEYNLTLNGLSIIDNNLIEYLNSFANSFLFDSGRSAIKTLAAKIDGYNAVLLPDYICVSVIKCFDLRKVIFYKTKADFSIDIEDFRKKAAGEAKVFFLVHYYGKMQSQDSLDVIRELAEKNDSVIIEDATHSLLTNPHTIGDYVVTSLRKWVPVSGAGALMAFDDKLDVGKPEYPRSKNNQKAYGMILKDMFLNEKLDCNSVYRDIFVKSEAELDEQKEILAISDFSEFLIKCYDIDHIKTRRQANYKRLKSGLNSLEIQSLLEFNENECPFALPIRVPNRDEFRKYLIDNMVYCAVHWPADGIRENERVQAIANSSELISLPIDQRYEEEHMDYVADVIGRYRGNLRF